MGTLDKALEVLDMKKTILKQVEDELVYFSFEDEISYELENNLIIICGNNDFISFGDKTLIDIIANDYYDDDLGYDYNTLDELKKITNKEWCFKTIKGYSQGDWQTIYYIKDSISDIRLKNIESYYFGMFDEYKVYEDCIDYDDYDKYDDCEYDYSVYIPHSIVWQGKEAICKWCGLDSEECKIVAFNGYKKIAQFKEME